ncbi:hypothetical protein Gotri_021479, partial [Gossypium trilobum]|nr:hypothetical protein [Gossypium trilobum]
GFEGFRGVHIVITTVDKIDAYQCFDFSTEDCPLCHMGYLGRPPKSPLIKIKFDVAFNKQSNRSRSGIVCRNCAGEVLGSKMVVNNCVQTLFAVEVLERLQAVLIELGLGLRQRNELAYLDGRVSGPTSLQWNKTEEYYIYRGRIGNGGNGKEKKGIWKIDQRDEEYNRQKGVLVSKTDALPNGRGDDSIQWLVLDN